MKIIKIIILTSLILVSSGLVSCSNADKDSSKSEIDAVVHGVIETLVKSEQALGENVDSIFLICNGPILILDSSSQKFEKYDCFDLSFSNSRIRTVASQPNFNDRIELGKLNDYYFFEFDSITIGMNFIVARSTLGTLGTRKVSKFTYDRNTLKLIRKDVIEIIQY